MCHITFRGTDSAAADYLKDWMIETYYGLGLFGLFASWKNRTKLSGNFLHINLSSFPFTRVSAKVSTLEVEALPPFCAWLFFARYKQTYRSHAHLNRSGLRAGLSSQGLFYYMKIQFFIKLDFSQQLSFKTKGWKNSNFSGLLEWWHE